MAAAIVLAAAAACSDEGEPLAWSSATVVLGPLPADDRVTFEMGLGWRRDCRKTEDNEICTDVPRSGMHVAGGWMPDDVGALVEEEPGIYRRRSGGHANEVAFDYDGERYVQAMPEAFTATAELIDPNQHTVRVAWNPPVVSVPGEGMWLEVRRTDTDGAGFCYRNGSSGSMGVRSSDAQELDLCIGTFDLRLIHHRDDTVYGTHPFGDYHRYVERTITIAVE